MKKALLLLSSLTIFSMTACSKAAVVVNEVDPSDLYKMVISTSNNIIMKENGESRSLANNSSVALREYDSHNHVTLESFYSPDRELRYYESEELINGDTLTGFNAAADLGIKEADISYTNQYDKNGNLIYRFILHADNRYRTVNPNNASLSLPARKNYFITENYTYDDLNRIVFVDSYRFSGTSRIKEYDYYDYDSAIINRDVKVLSTTTHSTIQYMYQGNSPKFKSAIRHSMTTGGDHYYPYVTNVTQTIEREFDENNDIVYVAQTDEMFSATENPLVVLGGNTSRSSYYRSDYTVTYNTFDQYHCLVNSKTYGYTNDSSRYNSSWDADKKLIYETETDSTYYQNNPKKVSTSITTELNYSWRATDFEPSYYLKSTLSDAMETNVFYRSCSYDEQGRLKIDSLIKTTSDYFDLNTKNFNAGNITAGEMVSKSVDMYIY